MKCPVCGSDLRPSKKYPGKYLCDTCRKRFPASSVIPDSSDAGTKPDKAIQPAQIAPDPAPAAPSRKKRRPLFLIVLLVLIVLAAVLFKVFYLDKTSAAAKSNTQNQTESSKVYQTGETADYDGVQIVLDHYEESEGDEWNLPAEGNEFVFVHMTISNHSSTDNDLVVSSMASFENYCDDTKLDYSASAFTALATTSDYQKLDGTLAPGETLDGYLSLEVPKNWSSIKINYNNKVWSEQSISFEITR